MDAGSSESTESGVEQDKVFGVPEIAPSEIADHLELCVNQDVVCLNLDEIDLDSVRTEATEIVTVEKDEDPTPPPSGLASDQAVEQQKPETEEMPSKAPESNHEVIGTPFHLAVRLSKSHSPEPIVTEQREPVEQADGNSVTEESIAKGTDVSTATPFHIPIRRSRSRSPESAVGTAAEQSPAPRSLTYGTPARLVPRMNRVHCFERSLGDLTYAQQTTPSAERQRRKRRRRRLPTPDHDWEPGSDIDGRPPRNKRQRQSSSSPQPQGSFDPSYLVQQRQPPPKPVIIRAVPILSTRGQDFLSSLANRGGTDEGRVPTPDPADNRYSYPVVSAPKPVVPVSQLPFAPKPRPTNVVVVDSSREPKRCFVPTTITRLLPYVRRRDGTNVVSLEIMAKNAGRFNESKQRELENELASLTPSQRSGVRYVALQVSSYCRFCNNSGTQSAARKKEVPLALQVAHIRKEHLASEKWNRYLCRECRVFSSNCRTRMHQHFTQVHNRRALENDFMNRWKFTTYSSEMSRLLRQAFLTTRSNAVRSATQQSAQAIRVLTAQQSAAELTRTVEHKMKYDCGACGRNFHTYTVAALDTHLQNHLPTAILKVIKGRLHNCTAEVRLRVRPYYGKTAERCFPHFFELLINMYDRRLKGVGVDVPPYRGASNATHRMDDNAQLLVDKTIQAVVNAAQRTSIAGASQPVVSQAPVQQFRSVGSNAVPVQPISVRPPNITTLKHPLRNHHAPTFPQEPTSSDYAAASQNTVRRVIADVDHAYGGMQHFKPSMCSTPSSSWKNANLALSSSQSLAMNTNRAVTAANMKPRRPTPTMLVPVFPRANVEGVPRSDVSLPPITSSNPILKAPPTNQVPSALHMPLPPMPRSEYQPGGSSASARAMAVVTSSKYLSLTDLLGQNDNKIDAVGTKSTAVHGSSIDSVRQSFEQRRKGTHLQLPSVTVVDGVGAKSETERRLSIDRMQQSYEQQRRKGTHLQLPPVFL